VAASVICGLGGVPRPVVNKNYSMPGAIGWPAQVLSPAGGIDVVNREEAVAKYRVS